MVRPQRLFGGTTGWMSVGRSTTLDGIGSELVADRGFAPHALERGGVSAGRGTPWDELSFELNLISTSKRHASHSIRARLGVRLFCVRALAFGAETSGSVHKLFSGQDGAMLGLGPRGDRGAGACPLDSRPLPAPGGSAEAKDTLEFEAGMLTSIVGPSGSKVKNARQRSGAAIFVKKIGEVAAAPARLCSPLALPSSTTDGLGGSGKLAFCQSLVPSQRRCRSPWLWHRGRAPLRAPSSLGQSGSPWCGVERDGWIYL